ncbi:MAG: Cu(I)-responsive transcriptional regulator [Hyphomicrobiaceae bacterium]
MNIGEVSSQSGLSAKTIRYYEDIGLILPSRSENGYRDYCEVDLHNLKFLQRARSLGFSIDECRQLLSLYSDRNRASSDVKSIAKRHLQQIEDKIAELEGLKATLRKLVTACRGDHRPDCPILDDLSTNSLELRQ